MTSRPAPVLTAQDFADIISRAAWLKRQSEHDRARYFADIKAEAASFKKLAKLRAIPMGSVDAGAMVEGAELQLMKVEFLEWAVEFRHGAR